MNPPVTLAWHGSACVLGIALAGLAPALTVADTHKRAQDWQFMARLYGWFPSVSGDLNHALPGGQDSATVDAGDILDALQGVFMGSFLARKGKWSLLTDLIYLDLSNGKNSTISILGDSGLGVDVDADLKLTGWVWNLAGGYTLYSANRANVDVLLGVRMLSIDTETKLTVDGPLPPILPSAKLSKSETLLDGIVGVKGRIALTDTWYSPSNSRSPLQGGPEPVDR